MSFPGRRNAPPKTENWRPLEAICPFLALEADERVALEVPDRDHRCHAVDPHAELSRREQSRLCLTGRHRSCPRYLARVGEAVGGTTAAAAPALTPAVLGVSATRLVATPETVSLASRAAALARPLGVAASAVAALVLVVSLAVAAGNWVSELGDDRRGPVGRQLGGAPAPATEAPVATAAATPIVTPPPPTPAPATPAPATPTPAPVIPPPVAVEPQVYVVQRGDTLISIAERFGTTAEAIMVYNGLESDLILIDQVLLIPS